MNSYRVHYKKGDFEVEVESTDRSYVDQMLQRFVSPPASTQIRERESPKGGRRQNKGKGTTATEQETTVNSEAVASAVHESDRFGEIEKNVLNKRSALGKILVTFHFAHEKGYEYLTTGDVEKITDELGVKIASSNVSHCITANRKYFSRGTMRRRGAKVPYKLNRLGELTYEKYVTGEKAE